MRPKANSRMFAARRSIEASHRPTRSAFAGSTRAATRPRGRLRRAADLALSCEACQPLFGDPQTSPVPARMGTNRHKWRFGLRVAARAGNTKAAVSGGFVRLRGKDSNLDYLIQSQASYH